MEMVFKVNLLDEEQCRAVVNLLEGYINSNHVHGSRRRHAVASGGMTAKVPRSSASVASVEAVPPSAPPPPPEDTDADATLTSPEDTDASVTPPPPEGTDVGATPPPPEGTDAGATPPPPEGTDADTGTDTSDVELDSAGQPWNPEIHSEGRSKLQDGTWRRRRNSGTKKAGRPAAPPPPGGAGLADSQTAFIGMMDTLKGKSLDLAAMDELAKKVGVGSIGLMVGRPELIPAVLAMAEA